MQEFAQQLRRCAQSDEEAIAFMEAFARVRLEGITKALAAPFYQTAAAEEAVAPRGPAGGGPSGVTGTNSRLSGASAAVAGATTEVTGLLIFRASVRGTSTRTTPSLPTCRGQPRRRTKRSTEG
jgi:hypothetical protein